MVEEIEGYLQQRPEKEFNSEEIGKLVLAHLKKESEVAYIRFASVYGQFQGIKDFVEILDELQPIEIIDDSQWNSNLFPVELESSIQ